MLKKAPSMQKLSNPTKESKLEISPKTEAILKALDRKYDNIDPIYRKFLIQISEQILKEYKTINGFAKNADNYLLARAFTYQISPASLNYNAELLGLSLRLSYKKQIHYVYALV